MDLDEFRVMLSKSKVDVWALIDTAITVASLDYGEELRDRRDKIVEKLYLASSAPPVGRSYENDVGEEHDEQQLLQRKRSPSPLLTPESNHRNDDEHENNEDEGEDLDPFGGLFEEEDEQTRILELKERLEDLDQSEESIIELLQSLADMEITFPVLQSSEIGRHVSKFKRHRSSKVRDLVKLLVSKWKETVDEWVKLHPDANLSANEDSPQQNVRGKAKQNGQHQGSDFAYSPNPYGGSSSERNYSELERKPKPAPPREAPPRRPPQSAPKSVSAPPANRQKESTIDLEKLNSARKRLQENYQEAQNAKKQRTIQVMDIHELPKPKNAFFSKNKGGFQGRHHR